MKSVEYVKQLTMEIKLKKMMKANPVEIGDLLIELKEAIPRGYWMQWVKYCLGWNHSTVNQYMRIARELKPFYTTKQIKSSMDIFNMFFGGNEDE